MLPKPRTHVWILVRLLITPVHAGAICLHQFQHPNPLRHLALPRYYVNWNPIGRYIYQTEFLKRGLRIPILFNCNSSLQILWTDWLKSMSFFETRGVTPTNRHCSSTSFRLESLWTRTLPARATYFPLIWTDGGKYSYDSFLQHHRASLRKDFLGELFSEVSHRVVDLRTWISRITGDVRT